MFAPRPHTPPRYAVNNEPGVRHVWRHEDQALVPQRRQDAVRELAARLGVPPAEVHADAVKTVEGHTRIVASWTPT